MQKITLLVIILLAIVIFVSFFMPWVSLESKVIMGVLTKTLMVERQAKLMSISGYDVPVMANGEDAKLMISIIKLFNPNVTGADKKSYLIWGIPILALAIAVANLFLGKNKWFSLGVGIFGLAIFAVAVFKIKTTDLDKLVMSASIGSGLWITLWGYLGIGLCALANAVPAFLKKS